MATIIDPSISYIINNNLAQYHDLFMECCHHTAEFPKGAILSRSGDPKIRVSRDRITVTFDLAKEE